jgi:aspartate/glutamate racemase
LDFSTCGKFIAILINTHMKTIQAIIADYQVPLLPIERAVVKDDD